MPGSFVAKNNSDVHMLSTQDQFPEYPEQLKMSISLARRMQEPLQEFATLASSPDDEILALRLHPLQSELSADILKQHLEEEVVTRVNDMGVDVHYLQEHTHVQGMLQYVCGLGPRKAAAILKVSVEWVWDQERGGGGSGTVSPPFCSLFPLRFE